MGFSASLRSHQQAGAALFAPGKARMDFSVPTPESCHLDIALSPRSLARLDLLSLVLDLLYMGSPMSLRSFSHLGLMPSLFGLARSGLVSLLPATSVANLGSPPPLQSRGYAGFASPAPDSLALGFMLSLQSPARTSSSPPVFGKTCSDFPPSALDFLRPGFVLLLRSMSQPGLSLLALDLLHPEPPLSSQSLACSESVALASSCTKPEASSLTLDPAHTGPSTSARSRGHSGAAVPTSDLLRPGSAPFLRSYGRCGSTLFVFGIARSGSLFFLPVTDTSHLGSFPPLRSFTHLESSVPAFDSLQLGFSLSLRALSKSGSVVFAFGAGRCGLLASVLDFAHLGLLPPLRSHAKLGSFLSVFDLLMPGFPTPMRTFARTGSSSLASGKFSSGPSSIPVLGYVHSGPSPSAQSSVRLDPPVSASDFLTPGSLVSLRGCARAGFCGARCGKRSTWPFPGSLGLRQVRVVRTLPKLRSSGIGLAGFGLLVP